MFIMVVGFFQTLNFIHQRFRYILAAKGAESSCTHLFTSCKHLMLS